MPGVLFPVAVFAVWRPPWLRWVVYGALALGSVFLARYWAQGEFIG
jgi:hypothetical protein